MIEECLLFFNGANQTAEDWGFSDHRAITISWGTRDFGPKPFCFYNYWLMEDGFKQLVEEWWGSMLVEGWGGYVMQKKLKGLREKIREWRRNRCP